MNLIEDDTRRGNRYLEFLPVEDFLFEGFELSELALNDSGLNKLAIHAATEDDFQQAIDVVSMMEASSKQMTALLEIAQHHSDNTTLLTVDMVRSLTQLQQRFSEPLESCGCQ